MVEHFPEKFEMVLILDILDIEVMEILTLYHFQIILERQFRKLCHRDQILIDIIDFYRIALRDLGADQIAVQKKAVDPSEDFALPELLFITDQTIVVILDKHSPVLIF
jgi:hypothetical protein